MPPCGWPLYPGPPISSRTVRPRCPPTPPALRVCSYQLEPYETPSPGSTCTRSLFLPAEGTVAAASAARPSRAGASPAAGAECGGVGVARPARRWRWRARAWLAGCDGSWHAWRLVSAAAAHLAQSRLSGAGVEGSRELGAEAAGAVWQVEVHRCVVRGCMGSSDRSLGRRCWQLTLCVPVQSKSCTTRALHRERHAAVVSGAGRGRRASAGEGQVCSDD
eukprot:351454-Chlamydomonas_euryale.AAC.4